MNPVYPITALIACLTLVPVARFLAPRIGAMDDPGALSVHERPTARTGGVAIWLAAALTLTFAVTVGGETGFVAQHWIAAALAASGMLALGLIDDIAGLGPWFKLLIEIFLAVVVVRYGWHASVTGIGGLDMVVSAAWIIGLINALNAFDGLDGLASGVSLLGLTFLGIWFLSAGEEWSAIVAFSTAGAVAGFLFYNFPPSRGIFLGDSGSLFLGFMLSILTLRAVNAAGMAGTASWVPVFFVAVPLAEAIYVVARRLLRGSSPLRGDRLHLYDECSRRFHSARGLAVFYYCLTAAVAVAAWWASGLI